MWWGLGHKWASHRLNFSHSLDSHKFPESYTRRSYTGIMRISVRMLEWALEGMFVPRKMNWAIDELFFRTTCEMEPDCKYFPLNDVKLKNLGAMNLTSKNLSLVQKSEVLNSKGKFA